MSWRDRIENTVFTITTGDGKVFTPLWKNGESSLEFNVSTFDYINLEGSEIVRKKAKAEKFPLLFWFQGDDNIDQSAEFKQSSKDNRAWKVQHPFYGNITGQPVSISFNDNNFGITEVTVDFWETITAQLPKATVSIPDTADAQYTELATISPEDYAAKVDLKPADVSTAKNMATKMDALFSKALYKVNPDITSVTDSVNSYYNNYQLVKSAMFNGIDSLITAPVTAIQSVYTAMRSASQFGLSVNDRISLFNSIYGNLLGLLGKPTANNKALFETMSASAISAMCLAAVNPLPGNYTTRKDIATTAAAITSIYNRYQQQLDNSYIPLTTPATAFSGSRATQATLQNTVISSIANLNTLAFNAKQERNVIIDKDSNLIVLTHKYMGLDNLDANIESFRTLNNIRNKELFLVKKGRKIKYLV